jgi:tetratricopeptide (TPR) repeat protein
METKWSLDACRKAFGLAFLVVVLASCSLPRIAILHDPLSPEEHVNLGVAYEKRGELDAALKEYKAAAKQMPLAHLYMGNVYFQQEQMTKARKAYEKAIDKTESAEAYNNLAWLYYTTDATKLDEAEQLALKATERAPQSEAFKDTLRKIREKRAAAPPASP